MPATKNAPRLPNSGSRMIDAARPHGEGRRVRQLRGAPEGDGRGMVEDRVVGDARAERHPAADLNRRFGVDVDGQKLAAALGRLINAPDLISIIEKKGAVLRIIKDHIA